MTETTYVMSKILGWYVSIYIRKAGGGDPKPKSY